MAETVRSRERATLDQPKDPKPSKWRLTELAVVPTFHILDDDGRVKGRVPQDPGRVLSLMECEVPEVIYEMLEKHGLTPKGERMR